jgi:hypothetical protein
MYKKTMPSRLPSSYSVTATSFLPSSYSCPPVPPLLIVHPCRQGTKKVGGKEGRNEGRKEGREGIAEGRAPRKKGQKEGRASRKEGRKDIKEGKGREGKGVGRIKYWKELTRRMFGVSISSPLVSII